VFVLPVHTQSNAQMKGGAPLSPVVTDTASTKACECRRQSGLPHRDGKAHASEVQPHPVFPLNYEGHQHEEYAIG
jgi:hypothetical protein